MAATSEETLSDEQFAIVAAFASQPAPPALKPTDEEINKIITTLASVLKSPTTSINHGKLKLAVYRKALSRLSLTAIQAAANRAIETLEWFPTPSEMLRLANGHEGEAQRLWGRAVAMKRNRLQRLMEEALAGLKAKSMSFDDMQALPQRTAEIAETQGLILIRMDGSRHYRTPELLREDAEERKRAWETGVE